MSLTDEQASINAFADVRRAFRLLWAYQRRVVDLNRIIRERFALDHYETYYNGSRPSSRPEGKWIWDLLPGVLMGFESVRHHPDPSKYPKGGWPNHPLAGDFLFLCLFEADSGFSESRNSHGNEPNASKFPDVQSSKSNLHLTVFLNQTDREKNTNWYQTVEEGIDSMVHGSVVGHPRVPGMLMYSETIKLTKMMDEEGCLVAIDMFSASVAKELDITLNMPDAAGERSGTSAISGQ